MVAHVGGAFDLEVVALSAASAIIRAPERLVDVLVRAIVPGSKELGSDQELKFVMNRMKSPSKVGLRCLHREC